MHQRTQSSTASAAEAASNERRTLNLSSLSDQECARVLGAFERLSPGESFEIHAKQPADKLVGKLKARQKTRFYWWPLERGPLAWRVILAKPALGAPASVAAAMGADRLRLSVLWAQFERAVELCQLDLVHSRSAELSLGLQRYIDIEESILFPVLEGQTKMNMAGQTDQMRTEHREIWRIVNDLDKLRTTTDCAAVLEMFDRPVEPMTVFQQHCSREEATLYPLMDMLFNSAEKRELLVLLQEFEI